MRKRTWMTAVAIVALGVCSLGCGESDVGEECDEPGSTQECVADAVCTNEEAGGARCRLICTTQDDCPDGFNCNGVSEGSLKSCQP